jgi:hypothetical protein
VTSETDNSLSTNSDENGDLWLHTDDPASVNWTVVVVEKDARSVAKRDEVPFPALNYKIPVSAWFIGRDYCHVEIEDEKGQMTMYGWCRHTHPDSF